MSRHKPHTSSSPYTMSRHKPHTSSSPYTMSRHKPHTSCSPHSQSVSQSVSQSRHKRRHCSAQPQMFNPENCTFSHTLTASLLSRPGTLKLPRDVPTDAGCRVQGPDKRDTCTKPTTPQSIRHSATHPRLPSPAALNAMRFISHTTDNKARAI